MSTRNIGVVTKFGRPTGTDLTNGLHLKSPLAKVHEMDGATQILNRTGKDATTVRLGNNSLAQVDNTIRWRIVPAAAPALYLDYRSFDGVRDNPSPGRPTPRSTKSWAASTRSPRWNRRTTRTRTSSWRTRSPKSCTKVGRQIVVEQVIIPVVRFDAETQKRIDAFNTEVANTRVAEQRQKTAKADAEANRIIADSVKNDPNVVTARCIDQAIKAGSPGRLLARRLGHHRCQIAAPVTQIAFAELLELLGHTEHTPACATNPSAASSPHWSTPRRCCR